MAREFNLMPWQMGRLTRREYDLLMESLKAIAERSS